MCDHTIVAADGDPVHNQATVTGVHDGGTVSDTDTHDIDVLHPDIDLENRRVRHRVRRDPHRLHLRRHEYGRRPLRHLGRRRYRRARR